MFQDKNVVGVGSEVYADVHAVLASYDENDVMVSAVHENLTDDFAFEIFAEIEILISEKHLHI